MSSYHSLNCKRNGAVKAPDLNISFIIATGVGIEETNSGDAPLSKTYYYAVSHTAVKNISAEKDIATEC
ncbi:Hypothetical predicted protein [Octopus vulgaris]|uniref:Uncharacterized protein n=1 Tax=Octopus vulgaris TaxID=6645 RepID=A0AA36B3C1_OCTVU|nr:Hypothetical predicted protein [Octopus vulgaris]